VYVYHLVDWIRSTVCFLLFSGKLSCSTPRSKHFLETFIWIWNLKSTHQLLSPLCYCEWTPLLDSQKYNWTRDFVWFCAHYMDTTVAAILSSAGLRRFYKANRPLLPSVFLLLHQLYLLYFTRETAVTFYLPFIWSLWVSCYLHKTQHSCTHK
jgi:hypothetical protein